MVCQVSAPAYSYVGLAPQCFEWCLSTIGNARFGGGRGRGDYQDYGPPAEVVEAGIFQHPCEGEVVCKLTNEKVLYRLSSASANAAFFLLVKLLPLVLHPAWHC